MGPVVRFQRWFVRFHRWVYLASRGWLGHRWTFVPCLVLWTTGRRSGQRRGATIVYVRDGEAYVIVGSNFGGDRPPAWLLNLQAQPKADIWAGRRRVAVEADLVWPDDPDRARLWALVNRPRINRDRFTRYQAGTDRPIPVVRLVPAGTASHD